MNTKILLVSLLALLASPCLFSQKSQKPVTLSGNVYYSDHSPAEGAIIIIDGLKTKYKTDSKGRFEIKVSPYAANIAVSFRSQKTEPVQISGRKSIDFILKADAVSEVSGNKQHEKVEIGYGTIDKKSVTSSVSKSDVQNKKYSSYTNIYELLRNEVPAVQVSGTNVSIRGVSTFGGDNTPLFVVDGVPSDQISDVFPGDVKTISVLRGSDAAVYGMKGANGVIIITTLRGADKRK
jgi:TonB-dependent SusC/RagA subfamily outer membrane receptor